MSTMTSMIDWQRTMADTAANKRGTVAFRNDDENIDIIDNFGEEDYDNDDDNDDDYVDDDYNASDDDDDDETCLVEQTIETMKTTQQCAHPLHYHSFAQVGLLISGPMRNCVACNTRLHNVLGYGGDRNRQVLRCVACKAYAHRSCAMISKDSARRSIWEGKHCQVNGPKFGLSDKTPSTDEKGKAKDNKAESITVNNPKAAESTDVEEKEQSNMQRPPPKTFFKTIFAHPGSAKRVEAGGTTPGTDADGSRNNHGGNEEEYARSSANTDDDPQIVRVEKQEEEHDLSSLVWTEEGPPEHWASEGTFLFPESNKTDDNQGNDGLGTSNETTSQTENQTSEQVQLATGSFLSVAKALQENVAAHFRHNKKNKNNKVTNSNVRKIKEVDSSEAETVIIVDDDEDEETILDTGVDTSVDNQRQKDSTSASDKDPNNDPKTLLEEVRVEPPLTSSEKVLKMAKGTLDVARTSSKVRRNIGIASVAGGIFGGVAGMFVAGPAGAVMGAKCGQTAGMIGVLLEGSITVGVIVAGAAAGSFTAKQIREQHEKRIIAIGEEGAKQKLLLVRPHVVIDPKWIDICAKAKRSAPENDHGMVPFNLVAKSPAQQAGVAQKERYRRDADIVQTDEFELATNDKVLLLVSRILNDKFSLPGHIYRVLLEEHQKRADQQRLEDIASTLDELEQNSMVAVQANDDGDKKDDGIDTTPDGEDNNTDVDDAQKQPTMRSRRDDAHAVIKHVTATLLEVRPGFASSPRITEMSAVAVEGLVFAKLYDSIFDEIREETREVDARLMTKIQAFDAAHHGLDWDEISPDALGALSLLQEARTAADKLLYAVRFLEYLSEHGVGSNGTSNASADCLLKMACQHLVVAKVPYMNAEIGFLEEFARDDQLLRGKEGYALVTLQASMHFLNASDNFDRDIFLTTMNE